MKHLWLVATAVAVRRLRWALPLVVVPLASVGLALLVRAGHAPAWIVFLPPLLYLVGVALFIAAIAAFGRAAAREAKEAMDAADG